MIINGIPQTHIPASDRAIQYGDGCFTTIAWRSQCLEFYALHMARLARACQRLNIPFDAWQAVTDSVSQLLKTASEDSVVKILISRGSGGRGYSPAGCNTPTFIVSLHPMPNHYADWRTQGIALTCTDITLAKQPLLAGIKHLNRLEQVLIKAELETTSFVDALVCDTDQHIVESAVGNVFWQQHGHWFTPTLESAGVEGVYRQALIELLNEQHTPLEFCQQPIAALQSVNHLYVCNALMKLVPVTALHLSNQTLTFALDPDLPRLQELLDAKCYE